jgi:hypothetical protein
LQTDANYQKGWRFLCFLSSSHRFTLSISCLLIGSWRTFFSSSSFSYIDSYVYLCRCSHRITWKDRISYLVCSFIYLWMHLTGVSW